VCSTCFNLTTCNANDIDAHIHCINDRATAYHLQYILGRLVYVYTNILSRNLKCKVKTKQTTAIVKYHHRK